MAAAIVGLVGLVVLGTVVVVYYVLDWLDVLPRRHWLHKVVGNAFGLAVVLGLLVAPEALNQALDWWGDRENDPIQDIVNDIQERQEQSFDQITTTVGD